MPQKLRQSTATRVLFGPILLSAAGNAPASGIAAAIDHVSSGISLIRPVIGGVFRTAGFAASTEVYSGVYEIGIVAVDTANIGQFMLAWYNSTYLYHWKEWEVISQVEWDAEYGTDTTCMAKRLNDVKTTTDKFTFTIANRADVNTRMMNSVAVQGAGVIGNKWRG